MDNPLRGLTGRPVLRRFKQNKSLIGFFHYTNKTFIFNSYKELYVIIL